MKKILPLLSVFILFISTASYAQPLSNDDVPEGMEVKNINGNQVIVPIGAKIKQVGAQVMVEETKEYAARKVLELNTKFTELEKSQEDLKKVFLAIAQRIDEIDERLKKTEKQLEEAQAEE